MHDLGGDGPPLLLCHPTGFHGMAWAPLARHLRETAHCWAVDFRGHGDSTLPDDGDLRWSGMGEDVLAVVDFLAARGAEGPVLGVGHSMGGAAAVLAEQARPGTFAALWLYEPIVFPPMEGVPRANPMAAGARKRRAVFASRDEAFANYSSKPPMGSMTPEALHAYVDHGFRDRPDGTVELKCLPETEARVFEGSLGNRGFERLGEVACPVTVAASGDGFPPAQMAPLVADALPHGRFARYPELTHFGPMEDPAGLARAITLDFVAFS